MTSYTASGSITTDWPSSLRSEFVCDANYYEVIVPQAVPINMTLNGDFPSGFPVGVNIDILGPTDTSLLAGMTFPIPSRPRDPLAVYPVACASRNTKCLLNKDGNPTISAVTTAVSAATAQTFLFYVFLPILLPGWFDVNYRVTFSFLDSYNFPDGTQVNNTLTGSVTWPAPINFTVRKRQTGEHIESFNSDGSNTTVPYSSGDFSEQFFSPSELVNKNDAPSLVSVSLFAPRDVLNNQQPLGSLLGSTTTASTDPLTPTIVNVIPPTGPSYPRFPFSDNLKVVLRVDQTASWVVAYSLDGTNFKFIQTEILVYKGEAKQAHLSFDEPQTPFVPSTRTYYVFNGESTLIPEAQVSTAPVDFLELKRNTLTNVTLKLWSTAGNVSTTRYLSFNYSFPDTDPTLDVFNLGNYQVGRPNFNISAAGTSFCLDPSLRAPFVFSVGKRGATPTSSVLNVTATLYLDSNDGNLVTGTFSGTSSYVDGISWVNIPINDNAIAPFQELASGQTTVRIVVTSYAQEAINYMTGSIRNTTVYTATYTFYAFNGTTAPFSAEIEGNQLISMDAYSNFGQATFKPVADSNGKPSFPVPVWSVGYTNTFFNPEFGPRHPIFYLNGGSEIVTVDSNTLLPYSAYPFGQNYVTIKVRERTVTINLNISSSITSLQFEVSTDGDLFERLDTVPAFNFANLETIPIALNKSIVGFRIVPVFDDGSIAIEFNYTSSTNGESTGTLGTGSPFPFTLPGQGLSYLLTLKAGPEGSYIYNVSQAPFLRINTLNNITSAFGVLTPAFVSSTMVYNLTFPFGTGLIDISAPVDRSISNVIRNVYLNSSNVFGLGGGLTDGVFTVSGINASMSTAATPLSVVLNVVAEDVNFPQGIYTIYILVTPPSTVSTLSSLSSYPVNIVYAPSTTLYEVTLPYLETLFKLSGTVNDIRVKGVTIAVDLYDTSSSSVVRALANPTVTVSNTGSWETANISAEAANSTTLLVRVTARVTAEDSTTSTSYVLNVRLTAPPASSSSSSTGSNTAASSSSTGTGSTPVSSSTGTGSTPVSSSTGTDPTPVSSSTGTGSTPVSSSTGTGSTPVSSSTGTSSTPVSSSTGGSTGASGSSSTGACVPGQTGCNSAYARAAVGIASPFAILIAVMAILLLA